MQSFEEICNRIKDLISHDKPGKKIFDKDVADILGINQLSFASMKYRNIIPYKEISTFCAQRRVCINWLLFNQSVDSLFDNRKVIEHAS